MHTGTAAAHLQNRVMLEHSARMRYREVMRNALLVANVLLEQQLLPPHDATPASPTVP